jgi:hypothetical protein
MLVSNSKTWCKSSKENERRLPYWPNPVVGRLRATASRQRGLIRGPTYCPGSQKRKSLRNADYQCGFEKKGSYVKWLTSVLDAGD